MLDFRHETFQALCQHKNYEQTARALCITQPAVSQHIKCLEGRYGAALIAEKGKSFKLTPAGKELLLFIQSVNAGLSGLRQRMDSCPGKSARVVIGATRSIGECMLPGLVAGALAAHPEVSFHLHIENTNQLLEKLQNGEIDFALIEGYIDSSVFSTKHFSDEEFIGVCAPADPFAGRTVKFQQLCSRRQIIREKGSGSREIYEEILHENHLNLSMFQDLVEVNNLAAIKRLVMAQAGISFLYKFSAHDELARGTLREIQFEHFRAHRKLHFVSQKNSLRGIDYAYWYDFLKAGQCGAFT